MSLYKFPFVIFFISFLYVTNVLLAQDSIYKRNGEVLFGKVIEISANEIRYKENNTPQKTEYTEKKSNIIYIKYSNGNKDEFQKEEANLNESEDQKKSTFVDNKIYDLGAHSIYHNASIREKEMKNLFFRTNDKNIMTLP